MTSEERTDEDLDRDHEVEALKSRLRDVQALNRRLVTQIDRLSHLEQATQQIFAAKAPKTLLPTTKANTKKRAIVQTIWSDWHVEEPVYPETVNGLNKYDLAIAYSRVGRLVDGILWKMHHHANMYHLDGLHVMLLGDLMTGWIHQENVETVSMSPLRTAEWLFGVLCEAFRTLLAKAPVQQIQVTCISGNHGRFTQKRRYANRADTSFEWVLYNRLSHEFKDDPRLSFWVPSSNRTYVDIYDAVYRCEHYDDVKYNGGVGGISIPLNNHIRRLEQGGRGRRADLTCGGHFHQLLQMGSAVVNGSLIGVTPYSETFGAEDPAQAYWLHLEDRGVSEFSGVWVRGRDEGEPHRRVRPADYERSGFSRPKKLWVT